MIQSEKFINALFALDIRFVTGVPDSLLKDVCACITTRFPQDRHIIASNEGSAIGLAIGHYLASGRPALVYMQNAGLGNVVNPITSLADPQVYGIPMILMVGWRGEILSDGSQLHDEPQHVAQGQMTIKQLNLLKIPFRIIDKEVDEIEPILSELVDAAISKQCPVALVVRKSSFSSFKLSENQQDSLMTREESIKAIIAELPQNVPVVSTTGMTSRELFELRKKSGEGNEKDFLTVGGMGHASAIATGIALSKGDQKVLCLDGDGALLMHMGILTNTADCRNLLHVVINNGVHDSVGGQPTKANSLDLGAIAKACGYQYVYRANDADEIRRAIKSMLQGSGSSFLEIQCRQGARPDLGRPDRTPAESKRDFMQFLANL